ncbi:MAG: translocation/assembly module TamB, partial [Prevotella sp.]|nr:translocation/assembly module TamB [Prevotella sp.]
ANTYNLDFLTSLLDLSSSGVKIPSGIDVNGKFTFIGNHISADMKATHDGGGLSGTIDFDPSLMAYEAILDVDKFPIDHFLPSMGLGALTAKLNVKGSGTDIMSTKTSLTAEAQVEKFKYGEYNLDGMNFSAGISSGKVQAQLNSNNPLIKGGVNLDAYVSNNILKSSLLANFDLLDLYGLKLIDAPLSTSFSCQVDLDTDLKSMLKADGDIKDIAIYDSSKVFRPEGLTLEALAKRDTTHIQLSCGDFQARVNSHGGIKDIISQSSNLSKDMLSSIKAKKIDVASLRKNMPLAEVYLSTGEDNPLSRFIQTSGLTFKETKIDLKSSPQTGLNGYAHIYGLNTGGMQLDTVRFNIVSDSIKCTYNGQVRNSQYNPQYVFNTLFDGSILENGLSLNVKFYDSDDVLGANLGLQALIEDEGLRLKMLSSNTVIAYKNFSVNQGNYIFLGSDRRISADLMLKADDGMSISLSSNDEDTSVLQDLTLKLNKFDLEKLFSSIPYMPDIAGLLDGDVHVVQTENDFSLSSKLSIANMLYEGYSLGNLGLNFVYVPKEGDSHGVDGQLTRNGIKVAEITGKYFSDGTNLLDAKLKMDRFPMALVNGFIPDRVVYLIGYGNGDMDVTGTLSSPKVDGDLVLDSCYLASALYGVNMRLDSNPIHISGSRIKFNNYKMYASNNTPLTVNGDFDFTSLDAMRMNLKLSATNLEAINAKENRKSVVYGKAYVDFYATLSGIVDNLKMQGRLDVLGTTDMSYILRDSPLTTDNQMDELVKFVNFEDSTETVVKHNPISGFTMDLTMNISQGARVMCYLNADQSNYIDLMGGGTLRLQYDEESEITLRGKYTLDNGEMKYSLPIIPLKTFTIQDGSYIEFTGDPMNPTLNITATETTNANVSSSGGGERNVTFNCGVVITKTLSDMGLEFTLDAPEDMSIHNELMEMGAEQRGKIAVTMLTTGMYLADGETGAFSMNNALSSFLQSEINNITGNALRSLDLSIGFDSATDASGNTHTDYS